MNADKALELARLAYPNDENLRVAYMLGLNAGAEWQREQKDPTLDDIAEKYAEKLDISKGWFDGCEIDELIKESYKAGAEWQAEQLLKSSPLPEDTLIFKKGVEEGKEQMMKDAEIVAQMFGSPCDYELDLDFDVMDKIFDCENECDSEQTPAICWQKYFDNKRKEDKQ